MYVQQQAVALITDGSGNMAATFTSQISGSVIAVRYVADATTPLSNNAVITAVGETTGLPIIAATLSSGSSSTQWYPRAATCDTSGAALLYALTGTAVADKITLGPERIKVTIASGGANKVGTLYFITG